MNFSIVVIDDVVQTCSKENLLRRQTAEPPELNKLLKPSVVYCVNFIFIANLSF